jgi:hypothetical protein
MTTSLEFVTLNDSEAKAVLTNHVELRPDGEVIAVAVPADLAPEVQAVLRSLADSAPTPARPPGCSSNT